MKSKRFKSFYQNLSYLDIQELIEYFSIFDGFYNLTLLRKYENLIENIEQNILRDFDNLKKIFIFSEDKNLQADIEKTLHKLATGNRKHYSIYKDITQAQGKKVYKILYELNIIQKEISREKPIDKRFGAIKKELRGYKKEDKVRFSKEFYRFWYSFIYPNYDLLEKKQYKAVLDDIKRNLDYFVSKFFEELSNELIKKIYSGKVLEFGGYWDKNVEIDLYVKLQDDLYIVGECKWTNHKISKNTLNKLKKVSTKASLKYDYCALFSKSGFSKELEKNKDKELLLYDLDKFNRLLND